MESIKVFYREVSYFLTLDSGGPLFRFIDGKFVLYGLTSFGIPDPRFKFTPSIFTKVSYFKDWIGKTVKENTVKPTAEEIARSSAEAVGEIF